MLGLQRTAGLRASRRMMTTMFESKNKIKEVRAKYYANPAVGAENPTYLKEPTDKILFGVGVGGTFVGLVAISSGLYSMSYGINKTP